MPYEDFVERDRESRRAKGAPVGSVAVRRPGPRPDAGVERRNNTEAPRPVAPRRRASAGSRPTAAARGEANVPAKAPVRLLMAISAAVGAAVALAVARLARRLAAPRGNVRHR